MACELSCGVSSTDGDCAVSEAAARITVNPSPISASLKRRRRNSNGAGSLSTQRSSKKFPAPSVRIGAVKTIFAESMRPYDVP